MTPAAQTSALDSTTEVDLMRNINQTLLSKARTSIFIAHRSVPRSFDPFQLCLHTIS